MPLHEYEIEGTGERIEELFRSGETVPDVLESSAGRVARRVFPRIASTPGRWGDSPGNVRRFDRGLGCVVQDDRHAQAIARRRGLVDVRELGSPGEVDRQLDSFADRKIGAVKEERRELAEYDANLTKFGGDQHRAQAETWSAPRVRAGDTLFAKP